MTSATTHHCPVHGAQVQTSFFVQKGFEDETSREAWKDRVMNAFSTLEASDVAAPYLERPPHSPPPPGPASQLASGCSKSTNTRSNPHMPVSKQRFDRPKLSGGRTSSPSVPAFGDAVARKSHEIRSKNVIEETDQSVAEDKKANALLGPERNTTFTSASKRSRRQTPYSH